jgi:hypothetical protein
MRQGLGWCSQHLDIPKNIPKRGHCSRSESRSRLLICSVVPLYGRRPAVCELRRQQRVYSPPRTSSQKHGKAVPAYVAAYGLPPARRWSWCGIFYVHTSTHLHSRRSAHVHTFTHSHIRIFTHSHIHTLTRLHIYVFTYSQIHTCGGCGLHLYIDKWSSVNRFSDFCDSCCMP